MQLRSCVKQNMQTQKQKIRMVTVKFVCRRHSNLLQVRKEISVRTEGIWRCIVEGCENKAAFWGCSENTKKAEII